MHKIVVASDSFKVCLTSAQIADSVEAAIHMHLPECEVVKLAVADGGEGTVEAMLKTMGGERVEVKVQDPLGRLIMAQYAILADGVTAVMEMAAASGLTLLQAQERNPLLTSTYGTGQMIADALQRGCRRFLIGIGGSATNDCGMGVLEALGWRFYDSEENHLHGCGSNLSKVARIDDSDINPVISNAHFTIACDVDSPLYGPEGAAYVYAPQKGATPEMVKALDRGLMHFAGVVREHLNCDVSVLPGAGAAGGLGAAFKAFLDAELKRGAQMVLDAVGFDYQIKGADLIITGEGKIDMQTSTGKLPYAVALRAGRQSIPVIALCGRSEVERIPEFEAIYPITPPDMPLSQAMEPNVALDNLSQTLQSIFSAQ